MVRRPMRCWSVAMRPGSGARRGRAGRSGRCNSNILWNCGAARQARPPRRSPALVRGNRALRGRGRQTRSAPRSPAARSRHPAKPRRPRRGLANPHRGTAPRLRAGARRRAIARRHHGPNRRHPCKAAATSTRPCESAPKNNSPSTSRLGDARSARRHHGPNRRHPAKPRPPRRGLANPHRGTAPRLRAGSATCERAPSPWAKSPTSCKAAATLDEALRIQHPGQLPVYEGGKGGGGEWAGLGDVRSRAVTMGQIADILAKPRRPRRGLANPHRGTAPRLRAGSATCERAPSPWAKSPTSCKAAADLDEALRVRTEEQLPVYELARRRAIARRHHGPNRRHPAKPRPTSTRPCESAPRNSSPSTSRSATCESAPSPWAKSPTSCKAAADLHGLANPHRGTAPRLRAGSATCDRAPSPWAKSPTSCKAAADLDEALRLRTEEQLPVYEPARRRARARRHHGPNRRHPAKPRQTSTRPCGSATKNNSPSTSRLGDARARAVTMGQIADILQSRGDLDEALRIRTEGGGVGGALGRNNSPSTSRLGDVRRRAITMGQIADILSQKPRRTRSGADAARGAPGDQSAAGGCPRNWSGIVGFGPARPRGTKDWRRGPAHRRGLCDHVPARPRRWHRGDRNAVRADPGGERPSATKRLPCCAVPPQCTASSAATPTPLRSRP